MSNGFCMSIMIVTMYGVHCRKQIRYESYSVGEVYWSYEFETT